MAFVGEYLLLLDVHWVIEFSNIVADLDLIQSTFFGIIWYWHLHNSPTKYIFPLILQITILQIGSTISFFLLTHLMMNINFWVPWWPCFITMLFPWYENSIVTYSLSILQFQFNKQYITKIAVNKNLPN